MAVKTFLPLANFLFLEGRTTTKCVVHGANDSATNVVSSQFNVTLSDPQPGDTGKGPKTYKVKLTKVAEINPE